MFVWSKLSDARWNDAWEERFHALVGTSLVLTEFPSKPTVRVEVFCRSEEQATDIKAQFGGKVSHLADRDWVAFSGHEPAPTKIRDRFLVTPAHDPARLAAIAAENPGRSCISIPAEMAFGTGDHATTATCLRLLCDLHARGELPAGFSCLDLGCGSGILAIAAAKLGAATVCGLDFDPAAVRISKKNAGANGVAGKASFEEADILQWLPEPATRSYDLIFANLFSDVLQAAFPTIRRAMAPGGHLVLSGILGAHAPETFASAAGAGLHVEETRPRGKWVTAHATTSTPERPQAARRV
ncbi:hypothetical protein BH23VER1_BH23VER1_10810 [soil metagenome]